MRDREVVRGALLRKQGERTVTFMMVSGGPTHVKSMQKSGASDGVDNHGAAERPWVREKGQQIATPRFSTFTYKIIF